MSIDTPVSEFEDEFSRDDPHAQDGSVWASLRQQHAEVAAERKPLVLDVPGFDGLRVRYRYFPMSASSKSVRGIQKLRDVTEQALVAAIDTLLLACDEFLVANPVDPRAERLGPDAGYAPLCDPGEPPIRFDRQLAAGMQWPDAQKMSARQIVRRLFGGENGDWALVQHAREVTEWLGSEREQVAEDFQPGK
jgi:hypothetical protein